MKAMKWKVSIFLITFVALTLLTYDLPFIWDDWAYLKVVQEYDFGTLFCIPGRKNWWYRPLDNIFFYVLFNLFGYNALPYHIVKSLIHGMVAVLLFSVASEFMSKRWAFVTSMFFSFTGCVVYTTMWIGNFELFAQLFLLFSFLCFLRYLKNSRFTYLLGTVLGGICSVWAKDFGKAIPVVLFGYLLLFNRKKLKNLKILIALGIMMFFVLLPSFIPNLLIKRKIVLDWFGIAHKYSYGKTKFAFSLWNVFRTTIGILTNLSRRKFLAIGWAAAILINRKIFHQNQKFVICWGLVTFLPFTFYTVPRLDNLITPFTALLIFVFISISSAYERITNTNINLRWIFLLFIIYCFSLNLFHIRHIYVTQAEYWRQTGYVNDYLYPNEGIVLFNSRKGCGDVMDGYYIPDWLGNSEIKYIIEQQNLTQIYFSTYEGGSLDLYAIEEGFKLLKDFGILHVWKGVG